jgi:hypothetical protein
MDRDALVQFARARGLAVLATTSAGRHPQAAVVGIAVTDDRDIVFDTTRTSRKFTSLSRQPRVALQRPFLAMMIMRKCLGNGSCTIGRRHYCLIRSVA